MSKESRLLSRTSTIGDSNVDIDIHELRKRIEPIIRNPHSMIHFPHYRDYDRETKYTLEAIGQWLLRTPTPYRIYTRNDRSFIFAKHMTFDNMDDIPPRSQQKRIAKTYKLSRISRRFPPFYSLAYHTEYGNTSYWCVSHLKDIITNKLFAHGISMSVMIDSRTRRPQKVVPAIRAICDNNWINEYPKEFKENVYPGLKRDCMDHITILNDLKKKESSDKKLIYSYPVQMRYRDEDQNKHLNTHTYCRYTYEGLMNYDKKLLNNEAVIYWMTNLFWDEIRMQNYSHCYVNIWDVKYDEEKNMKIYIGTIDIDEKCCSRDNDDIRFNVDRNNGGNIEWKHYHGFMAGVVDVESTQSKL